MKYRLLLLSLFVCTLAFAQSPRVLVFTRTAGYYHKSIPAGEAALMSLGNANGFAVDTTAKADAFTPENLRRYQAIVFLSTTLDVLNDAQQEALKGYIEQGGGYVGIHSASDTEFDWPWYGQLVGAYFTDHPEVQQAKATLTPEGKKFFQGLDAPATWERLDELYNYKDISPDIKPLYLLDESTYTGGKNGSYHPIVWYHTFDGGRSFYIGFGHTDESYTDPVFLKLVLRGLQYAMGTDGARG